MQAAEFLYGEIASRLLERLSYIRLQPSAVADMGCATGLRWPALHARYPNARYHGVDNCPSFIAQAQRNHAPTWLGRLRRATSPQFHCADLASTGLPPETFDLIWSNAALHWHLEPHRVLAEWARLLRVQGLCLFSCFGVGTFSQLRLAAQAIGATPFPFVDMHDFGDMLIDNGFLDPVMDQETITLTYKTSAGLLRDVQALGGNPVYRDIVLGLRGRQWYERLCQALEAQRQADGLLHLSIEVVYGHAWRSAVQRRGQETLISVSSLRRSA